MRASLWRCCVCVAAQPPSTPLLPPPRQVGAASFLPGAAWGPTEGEAVEVEEGEARGFRWRAAARVVVQAAAAGGSGGGSGAPIFLRPDERPAVAALHCGEEGGGLSSTTPCRLPCPYPCPSCHDASCPAAAALARDVRGLCAAMPAGLVWETAQRLPSALATAALSAVLEGTSI